jgi:hypothetical protein
MTKEEKIAIENELRSLAIDAEPRVLLDIADHPDAPGDLVEEIIERAFAGDASLMATLAGIRRLPEASARRIAEHPASGVRSRLATRRHGDLPDDVLLRLAKDEERHVRESLAWAGGRKLPLEALLILADDEDAVIRRLIAENEGLPAAVLDRLASDVADGVRVAAAGNPALSERKLRELSKDEFFVRRRIAERRDVPADVLADLARDPCQAVRDRVAVNSSTTPDSLGILLGDDSNKIRAKALERLRRASGHEAMEAIRALMTLPLSNGAKKAIIKKISKARDGASVPRSV